MIVFSRLPLPPSPHPPRYIPGLRAQPWWDDKDDLPWISALEAAAPTIQAELRDVLAADASTFAGDSALQSQVMGAGWSALRLQRLGNWNEEVLAKFPVTARILEGGSGSTLKGNGGVDAHRRTHARMRTHAQDTHTHGESWKGESNHGNI